MWLIKMLQRERIAAVACCGFPKNYQARFYLYYSSEKQTMRGFSGSFEGRRRESNFLEIEIQV